VEIFITVVHCPHSSAVLYAHTIHVIHTWLKLYSVICCWLSSSYTYVSKDFCCLNFSVFSNSG
jgi:hypothetical protein